MGECYGRFKLVGIDGGRKVQAQGVARWRWLERRWSRCYKCLLLTLLLDDLVSGRTNASLVLEYVVAHPVSGHV